MKTPRQVSLSIPLASAARSCGRGGEPAAQFSVLQPGGAHPGRPDGPARATQLQTTGTITYFFATRQDWLLGGALALLAASGLWSVRKLARAACLAHDGCEVPAAHAAAAIAAAAPEPPGDGEPGQ